MKTTWNKTIERTVIKELKGQLDSEWTFDDEYICHSSGAKYTVSTSSGICICATAGPAKDMDVASSIEGIKRRLITDAEDRMAMIENERLMTVAAERIKEITGFSYSDIYCSHTGATLHFTYHRDFFIRISSKNSEIKVCVNEGYDSDGDGQVPTLGTFFMASVTGKDIIECVSKYLVKSLNDIQSSVRALDKDVSSREE